MHIMDATSMSCGTGHDGAARTRGYFQETSKAPTGGRVRRRRETKRAWSSLCRECTIPKVHRGRKAVRNACSEGIALERMI